MERAASLAHRAFGPAWARTTTSATVYRPPPAASLPPGAVVLSLSGTERDDLTDSVILYGMGIFALGLVTGYLIFRP